VLGSLLREAPLLLQLAEYGRGTTGSRCHYLVLGSYLYPMLRCQARSGNCEHSQEAVGTRTASIGDCLLIHDLVICDNMLIAPLLVQPFWETMPAPSPTATTLIVKMPNAVISRIDTIAKSAGLTRSQVVRLVLSEVDRADIPQEFYRRASALRPVA